MIKRKVFRKFVAATAFFLIAGGYPALSSAQEPGPDARPAETSERVMPDDSEMSAATIGEVLDTSPTLAGREEESRSSFDEFIGKIASAREIGLVLLVLSVIGFAFALERLFGLRRHRICPDGLAEETLALLKRGDFHQVAEVCRQQPSVLARILPSVARHHDFSFSDISTIAGDVASRELRGQMQRVYPLAIVATLSPLLGLLGTVIGMIGAFEAVAMAGELGDPSIMASDISYALITTAMGLAIAVPALGAYHVLRSRTNALSSLLDEQLSELISDWQISRNRQSETLNEKQAI